MNSRLADLIVITALSVALVFSALAQDAPTSPTEYDARIGAATRQRESQANDVVFLAGKLAMANVEIERLKKEAAICKPEKVEPKKE